MANINTAPAALLKKVDNSLRKATARALNRTAASVLSRANKEVAKDLGLKQKDSRSALRIAKATENAPRALVIATGKRIPLIAFVKPSVPEQVVRQLRDLQSGRRGGGVTYVIGNVKKMLPSSFIAQMRSGHLGVFKRRGKKSLPIDERFGPSIPKSFVNSRVQAALREVINSRLATEMRAQMRYYAGRIGVTID